MLSFIMALAIQQAQPQASIRTAPEPNVQSTITAGEVMWSQRSVVTVPGVTISAPVDVQWGGLERVQLDAGAGLIIVSERRGRIKACQASVSYSVSGVTVNGYTGCLIDNQNDGVFERAAFNEVTPFSREITQPVNYTRGDIEISGGSVPSARTELLYQGSDGRTLNLTYREFRNGIARPAFTENLTVPLGETFPQQIAAKGHIFTVHSVTGLGLTYSFSR